MMLSPLVAAALGLAVGAAVAAAAAAVGRRRQRAAQARIAATEAERRALIEGAPDVTLVHALDGTEMEANRAGRAALGVADGVGLALLDAVAVADRAAARAHLAALADTGTARSDLRIAGPGTAPVVLDVLSRVVEVGGQRRVVSVGRDVTARRADERQLIEARDHAEEAARVRSQFLASMSHEIRTPLTSVVGFTEILRDEVAEPQRGLVEAIEAGGQRLLATLDSVLDLATLDARAETLRPAPIDVVAAVDTAIDKVRAQAAAKGIALDVSAAQAAVGATLDADALGRILAHVVGNAVRFTETGGVTIEVDADASAVALRVIDTGIGIPEDQLPTLFDGFAEGRGFGLAISHRLVQLMGGSITVESRWRAGTAVSVVLPRGEATLPAPREATAMA
ncbi:sensor histidine kinase [Rubrivirga sp. IMCC45206]|uniref:sensor histidine kinase n=1 Tax=Rubrivirga sp. IMCC45206 TaxID=3391614 RepID=UPI00398FEDE7